MNIKYRSRRLAVYGVFLFALPIHALPRAYQRKVVLSPEYDSTTTITVGCQTTVTLSTMPSYYITSATSPACTGTSASCPCALNYQCQELSPCLWGCRAHSTPTSTSKITSHQPSGQLTPIPTSTHRESSQRSTQSVPSQTVTATFHPPYAGVNVESYLPCVPGTFICVDRETWDTCDYDSGGNWVFEYPRKVAPGMECITFLSPVSGLNSQQAQQGSTPRGFYRDDRVVRARPDGDCSRNGAIKCTQGGQMFEVCDQGGWVEMGSVAAGTQCENGRIVSGS